MHCKLAILLTVLLLAPVAQAYHLSPTPDPAAGEVFDVRNRVLATQTVNLDNAPAGNLLTFTFPWDPEYSYADVSHTIRVQVHYTALYPMSSNGAWTVGVAKEITGNLASCSIRVESVDPTGISLDALLATPNWTWDCLFTQSTKPHYHYHTIYVNRTVASGSPSAMSAESISVRLETEDIVRLPNVDANLTAHDVHSDEHHHALDANVDATRDTIMDRLETLNVTIIGNVTGNFTLDDTTLSGIYSELQQHRQHSMELSMHQNNFFGLGFDGFLGLLVLLGIGYFAFRKGLDKNPAWGLVVFLDFIAILTLVLEDQWPFEASLPFKWAILAIALAGLLLYGIAGMGLTTGEWIDKRRAKKAAEESSTGGNA